MPNITPEYIDATTADTLFDISHALFDIRKALEARNNIEAEKVKLLENISRYVENGPRK